ncbi:MAG: hypothetical protein HOV81_10835 [Kofleriaceae bacterium]|nr:hypothetical protein [Kofleriaceae bacterium]
MKRLALLMSGLAALAACGDDSGTTADASIDGPPDQCAPDMTMTGEYIDWDSTETAFHGIFAAQFVHRGDPSKMAMTAPNGRFVMCIPAADGLVDITPMTGSDYVGGTVVVNKAVISSGAMQSYRSFTTTRAADFGFSASMAHVFVHVATSAKAVTLGATAGVTKHFDGSAWVDGNTGTDVYFGNVDPQATTTVSVGGTSAGTIPLTAGKFTYITVR